MRGDICIDRAKMKFLAQEEERVYLHDNVMMHKTDSKKPRTSLDPSSLSNLLHTTYTILLPSSQKVNAFEAETWELYDQNTVKCSTSFTAKRIADRRRIQQQDSSDDKTLNINSYKIDSQKAKQCLLIQTNNNNSIQFFDI